MNPGRMEWRRLVFACWVLFAVSFALHAYEASPILGDATRGAHAFIMALLGAGGWVGRASALTNLLMLFSLAILRDKWAGGRLVGGEWLPLALGGSAALHFAHWPLWVARETAVTGLLAGYWIWAASFVGAALGLWMLARDRASTA